jgi:glycosyltransferase involved in cell wall biosynthesis
MVSPPELGQHDSIAQAWTAGVPGALHVVILNQYYAPDVASTGRLLHELAVELVKLGADVSVVTSQPSYGPPETWVKCQPNEVRDGVRVSRLVTTRFSKDNLVGRAMNWLTFMVPMLARVLFTTQPDVVYLYTTNPPILAAIGAFVSLFRRHTYVMLLHDAYPHMPVWMGKIRKGGLVERLWHRLNRLMYRRAAETIVLCRKAKKLVCESYDVDPERVHVIPNWADGNEMKPKLKPESAFAAKHDLIKPFVLMYSGNLGLYYNFETMLSAAALLQGEPFRLVLIGAGGRKGWIAEQIRVRKLANTLLLPYQPFETISDSLAACDASLVTIARGVEGISFPSKLYSSLAIGRPIVALCEPDSELRELVDEDDVGVWLEPEDAEGLANAVRAMMAGEREQLEAQGRRARKVFEERYTLEHAGERYLEVLKIAERRL